MFVRFAVADDARGWILLRTMPLVGPLNEEMKTFVQNEFEMALQSGRMRTVSSTVATDMGIGLEIMTIHRILVDRARISIVDEAAEGLLLALGVAAKEAHRLSTSPIEETATGTASPRRKLRVVKRA
jgi:hypothetical protein